MKFEVCGLGCVDLSIKFKDEVARFISNIQHRTSNIEHRTSNMHLSPFPFSTTDWSGIDAVIYKGITGFATWKTVMKEDVRIRLVEYSKDYLADHWCDKGHIIYCVDGEMETELKDGRKFILSKGMMYSVGDNSDAHRTSSTTGCTLFIVD